MKWFWFVLFILACTLHACLLISLGWGATSDGFWQVTLAMILAVLSGAFLTSDWRDSWEKKCLLEMLKQIEKERGE